MKISDTVTASEKMCNYDVCRYGYSSSNGTFAIIVLRDLHINVKHLKGYPGNSERENVFQRPALRSYSEYKILWRVPLLVNTVTPVHPNPSQPFTGSQLSGVSTSSSPPSLTNFFRLDNSST